MKLVIVLIAILSTSAFAAPYVEYSNQQRYTDLDYSGEYNHVRIGYKADNGIYLEAGRDQDGNAFETGYNFNFNKRLSINGKWEGSYVSYKINIPSNEVLLLHLYDDCLFCDTSILYRELVINKGSSNSKTILVKSSSNEYYFN